MFQSKSFDGNSFDGNDLMILFNWSWSHLINKLSLIRSLNLLANYNPNRQRKILIVFDEMIADIKNNKKFQSMVEDAENGIYLLYLSHYVIFLFQMMSN